MKQHLLFDLDDTLIHCNKYFGLIIDQFIDEMTTWFKSFDEITPEIIRDKQTEIDIAGIEIVGFKSDHFPQSFVETYRHFSRLAGRPESDAEKERLWKLGLSVYEQEAEPYPHMEETLMTLRESGHELHLYTGGERRIQRRKIEKLKLERYFGSRIYIRRHKNSNALEAILAEGGFDRSRTWMIGNSIRTDVVPALTTGIHAIHVKTEQEWQYNIVDIDVAPKGAFVTVGRLSEVPGAIQNYVVSAWNAGLV